MFHGAPSSNMANVRILTWRFLLRTLVVEDVSEQYREWLNDEMAQRYIIASGRPHDLPALRAYVEERSARNDVLFLGIFTREGNQHIGNIKYEPIDAAAGSAEMGILIGEPDWRGCGVAREVILASARWLKMHRGISLVRLGVESDNDMALAAYLRAGFRRTGVIHSPLVRGEVVRMVLEFGS
jgi:ribosomal-protein-alanine N-acetyltransferase